MIVGDFYQGYDQQYSHPIYANPDTQDAREEQLVLQEQATMHSTSRQAKICIFSFFVYNSFFVKYSHEVSNNILP